MAELNPTSSGEFIRLFLQNERRIYAFIVSLLPDLTDAEDVLQETSVVLWEKFDQFQPGTNFVSWACKIAHFKVLKHFAAYDEISVVWDASTCTSFDYHLLYGDLSAVSAQDLLGADCNVGVSGTHVWNDPPPGSD